MPSLPTQPRTLIASRDPFTAELLRAILKGMGHAAHVARTADAARNQVGRLAFQLVLLDLDSLKDDGLRLLEEIRRERTETALPVIAITATDAEAQLDEAFSRGASRCLTKPVGAAALAACAELVLGGLSGEHNPLNDLNRTTGAYPVLRFHTKDPLSFFRPQEVDEFAAVPLRSGTAGRPGDTAEQVSTDWVLFKVMEEALSQAIEQRRPLSVLMLEMQGPVDKVQAAEGESVVTELIADCLAERQSLTTVDDGIHCVVLPGAQKRQAIEFAEAILESAESLADAGLPAVQVRIGIAILAGDFDGSPFRLIDWAHAALQRAKRHIGAGWWVHHGEPAY